MPYRALLVTARAGICDVVLWWKDAALCSFAAPESAQLFVTILRDADWAPLGLPASAIGPTAFWWYEVDRAIFRFSPVGQSEALCRHLGVWSQVECCREMFESVARDGGPLLQSSRSSRRERGVPCADAFL